MHEKERSGAAVLRDRVRCSRGGVDWRGRVREWMHLKNKIFKNKFGHLGI